MTLPTPTPLTAGGGGGGGLTAEADDTVLYDSGTSSYFLRSYVKDDAGAITGSVDTTLDGVTPFAPTGSVQPRTAVTDVRETQVLLMVDEGASDTPFLRVVRHNPLATATPIAVADYELDGTTPYSPAGPVSAADLQPAGGPNVVYTIDRYVAGDSPVAIAAGALEVKYVVLADDVSVNGIAFPAGERVAHGIDGTTTDALTFTIAGSGEVLVIEERAA